MITKKDLKDAGYAITIFNFVEAGDVDGVSYFLANVGSEIKSIEYRDVTGRFGKKDVFTYQTIGSSSDNVRAIYSVNNELFLGVWGTAAEPTKTKPGTFYYITAGVTIDTIDYEVGDVMGLFDVGYGVLKWRKGTLNGEQKLRPLV